MTQPHIFYIQIENIHTFSSKAAGCMEKLGHMDVQVSKHAHKRPEKKISFKMLLYLFSEQTGNIGQAEW